MKKRILSLIMALIILAVGSTDAFAYSSTHKQEWRSFPTQNTSTYTFAGTRAVQYILSQLCGYSITIDGGFGTNTKNAVKLYQAAHGLTVDGSVGYYTWGELYETTDNGLYPMDLGTFYYQELPSIDPLSMSYVFMRTSSAWYYSSTNYCIKSGL